MIVLLPREVPCPASLTQPCPHSTLVSDEAERGRTALWAGGRGSGPSDTAPRVGPSSQPSAHPRDQPGSLPSAGFHPVLTAGAAPRAVASLQSSRRQLEGTSYTLSTPGRHLCLSKRLCPTHCLVIPELRVHCLPGGSLPATNRPE